MYHQLLIHKATATYKKICASSYQKCSQCTWNSYGTTKKILPSGKYASERWSANCYICFLDLSNKRNKKHQYHYYNQNNNIDSKMRKFLRAERKFRPRDCCLLSLFFFSCLFLTTLLNLNLKSFFYILGMIILWFDVIDELANTFNIVNQ